MAFYRRDGSPISGTRKDSALIWSQEFETDDRHVGSTKIGNLWVSTVFVGLNMSIDKDTPLIYETMVFNQDESRTDDDPSDFFCERYQTEEQAIGGHERIVQQILTGTFTDYIGEPVDTTYRIPEEPTLD